MVAGNQRDLYVLARGLELLEEPQRGEGVVVGADRRRRDEVLELLAHRIQLFMICSWGAVAELSRQKASRSSAAPAASPPSRLCHASSAHTAPPEVPLKATTSYSCSGPERSSPLRDPGRERRVAPAALARYRHPLLVARVVQRFLQTSGWPRSFIFRSVLWVTRPIQVRLRARSAGRRPKGGARRSIRRPPARWKPRG